jgi:trk system potassium uptake protein TrkA
VETLHKIIDGKAEALEFLIRDNSKATGKMLQEMRIKKGILVASIYRKGKVIIPRGSDQLKVGDSVIIITREKGLNALEDILEK